MPQQARNHAPEATPAMRTAARELPKAYDPAAIEERWAKYWVERAPLRGQNAPGIGSHDRAFTVLLPPPNVTGNLHMGHMFEHTESDILVRWHRMLGETTLWLPGTDHAGIATQMLVERQLVSEGTSRQALGREASSSSACGNGVATTAARSSPP
jgi:valyl-tRNA synthetase